MGPYLDRFPGFGQRSAINGCSVRLTRSAISPCDITVARATLGSVQYIQIAVDQGNGYALKSINGAGARAEAATSKLKPWGVLGERKVSLRHPLLS